MTRPHERSPVRSRTRFWTAVPLSAGTHIPDRHVVLTFDDGPSVWTEVILDILAARGVKATFFLVGARAADRPDLVKRMYAEGHDVGVHTFTPRQPRERFAMATPAGARSDAARAHEPAVEPSAAAARVSSAPLPGCHPVSSERLLRSADPVARHASDGAAGRGPDAACSEPAQRA